MFWLKKAITFCLMPLQACLALMVLGMIIALRGRHPRFGRALMMLGTLLLLVLSHRQVGLRLLAPLEQTYPAVPELAEGYTLPSELEQCRYIVVLGGGHTDTGRLPATSQLSPYALARITEGVRLARLLPEAKLITTGPGAIGRPTHAEILARAAQSLGVDPARFVYLDQGRDTEGEAEAIRGTVGDAPFALVTSAWHMPRAMALMHGAGLKPYPCPTDFHAKTADTFELSNWLWGIDGLENSSWAIYERLGMAWAKLRGRTGD